MSYRPVSANPIAATPVSASAVQARAVNDSGGGGGDSAIIFDTDINATLSVSGGGLTLTKDSFPTNWGIARASNAKQMTFAGSVDEYYCYEISYGGSGLFLVGMTDVLNSIATGEYVGKLSDGAGYRRAGLVFQYGGSAGVASREGATKLGIGYNFATKTILVYDAAGVVTETSYGGSTEAGDPGKVPAVSLFDTGANGSCSLNFTASTFTIPFPVGKTCKQWPDA